MLNNQRDIDRRRSSKRLWLLCGVLSAATVLNLTATPRSRKQENLNPDERRSREKVEKIKKRFPVVDFEAPAPADDVRRARRRKRSERDPEMAMGVVGGRDAPPDSGGEVVLGTHWEVGLPGLPAAQSDLVVVGRTLDANAYLSDDRNDVDSEFTVQVEDVLKNVAASPVSPGRRVTAERQGGRVRYPSGRVWWFRISGQKMPAVGSRYVFFLKQAGPDSFSIITGYELRDGRVYALDGGQFTVYDGSDEASFLRLVQDAVAAQSATDGKTTADK